MLFRNNCNKALVCEMLDKLPPEVWTSDTTTFLDPAMASGQFVTEIERRLRNRGHSVSNIRTRVFGLETSRMQVNIAMNMNELIGTYAVDTNYKAFLAGQHQPLLKDCPMKFDIIVMNPPYQSAGGGSGQKLWKQFIAISEGLLKDGGKMQVLCPSSWGKPLGPNPTSINKSVAQAIFGNTINDVDFSASKYFPGVGVDISWFGITKNGVASHPHRYFVKDTIVGEILCKVISSGLKVPKYITEVDTLYKQPTTKVKVRTDKYCYPVLGKKIEWTDVHDPLMYKIKVLFPRDYGYIVMDDAKGEYAASQSAYAFVCDDTAKPLTWYRSKLMRFIMARCAWVPQMDFALFNLIPAPDLKKTWTDPELYQYFNLTQAEIDMIESTVK